ncbi:MAG TPA: hypothetical protein VD769_09410 [Gaiellaceae bacterium]|nr:hypothetical protein [Gaiellaceae bacterium]
MELATVLIGGGIVLGVLVGRWWALAPAAAPGVRISQAAEIEAVPGWYLGLVYSALGGLGVVAGILLGRRLRRAA